MDWVAIINMIIAILTTVLQFLGGGSPLLPGGGNGGTEQVFQLAANQWECEDIYWSMPPVVRSKHFTGTVAVDCQVEGMGGKGLAGLEEHLLTQVPEVANEIHEGPVSEFLGWLPSTYYELSYDIESEDDVVAVRGENHIATDKYSQLRSIFRSTEISENGGAEYLKKFIDELDVKPNGNGWYTVRLKSGSRVEKPWGMSDSEFKNEVSSQLEERLESRQEGVLNDVANQL